MQLDYGPPSNPEKAPAWLKHLAREFPGVRYDERARKYTASIMIDRKRIFLGSFETPEAAGAVYAAKRKAHPKRSIEQKAFGTVNACWQDFLAQAERNEKGFITTGQQFFAPDGQAFNLVAIDIRRGKFGNWVWFKWKASCAVCGEEFETTTKGRAKKLRGIVRTCPTHRGQYQSKKSAGDLV